MPHCGCDEEDFITELELVKLIMEEEEKFKLESDRAGLEFEGLNNLELAWSS